MYKQKETYAMSEIKKTTFIDFNDILASPKLVSNTQKTPMLFEPSKYTTMALGEEGGGTDSFKDLLKPIIDKPSVVIPKEPVYSTMALGEEGGTTIKPPIIIKEPTYTTMALGEEGGTVKPPIIIEPPVKSKPPAEVTTMALGEEGGAAEPPEIIKPIVDKPIKKPFVNFHPIAKPPAEVTTMALGEEGGTDKSTY